MGKALKGKGSEKNSIEQRLEVSFLGLGEIEEPAMEIFVDGRRFLAPTKAIDTFVCVFVNDAVAIRPAVEGADIEGAHGDDVALCDSQRQFSSILSSS